MAKVTAQGIRAVYEMLGLPNPSNKRVQELIDGGKSYTQIRDGVLVYMANADPDDDLETSDDVLYDIIDQYFADQGIDDAAAGGETEQERLDRIVSQIRSGERTLGEVRETIGQYGSDPDDPGEPDGEAGKDRSPGDVGGTVIPAGGRLIRIRNPEGSDADYLYFIVYNWRGTQLAYEVGDQARFRELFESHSNFDDFTTVNQDQWDEAGYIEVGSIDEEIGATESIGSRIERDIRALGFEDLPAWIANDEDALALIATATAQEWSTGRLWTELSKTGGFKERWGGVIDKYTQGGEIPIGEAIAQIEADEQALARSLRPYTSGSLSTEYLQDLINQGWTGQTAGWVAEQSQWLESDPERLEIANYILTEAGIETGLGILGPVDLINVMNGYGPQEVIEALNTATAATALEDAGIDLGDDDLDLIMDLVDTSDRLLTAESWRGLAQELSLNLIRFSTELDQSKLGIERDELVAAAFGQESPTGRSSGEVLGLLARFERDRRAAGDGFDQTTGFLDQEGRLRISGRSNL